MNIKTSLQKAEKMLENISETPRLDVEILLAFVLKKDIYFLTAHPEFLLSSGQQKSFGVALQRRLQGEPIAYIIGEWEFYGLPFFVDKNTLVPRPETELLVDLLLPHIDTHTTFVDVGTGSGCIPIVISNKQKAKSCV